MAATTNPVMTWEAFERLPDSDGMHRELIEGELQVLPPPKSRHAKIARKALRMLSALESAPEKDKRWPGQAYAEAGYKLTEAPPTWVEPDVSWLSNERAQATGDDDYFTGAPELAIEVISPSESAADVQRKVKLMLAAGSKAVWVVYPKTQSVTVHTPDGVAVTLGAGDSLTAPFLLKGWSAPVAELFAD